MSIHDSQKRPDNPNTYVILDRQKDREMRRLLVQDHMLNESMGGVLPEQPDPTIFQRVLDVGCGPGGWLIETAKAYPWMRLDGLDISQSTIAYARVKAEDEGVSDRVRFHVMDALRMIEFRTDTFDLVNLRASVSFVRTSDWPKMLSELQRVARPGGVIRITEPEISQQVNSPALLRLFEMGICALYRAGHLYTAEAVGLTSHLERLCKEAGFQHVQVKPYALEYQSGTPQGDALTEDVEQGLGLIRPFLQKWGCASDDYSAIYQQALDEMKRPDFKAVWNFLTIWGNKPVPKSQQP